MKETKVQSLFHQADLKTRDYISILSLLTILIAGWFIIPLIFRGTIEIAKFGAYFLASVSIAISAYAALSSFRLKMVSINKTHDSALGTIFSDVSEILQEVADLGHTFKTLPNGNHHEWNEAVKDFMVLEKRYERKQDNLVFLSTQFPPPIYIEIQTLYLNMFKLCMRTEKFMFNLPPKANLAKLQEEFELTRGKILEHFKLSTKEIKTKYNSLRNDIIGLEDLTEKNKE